MAASFVGRVRRRVAAEAWVLDAVRRQTAARRLRGAIERRRSQRIVDETGSVDAALDAIAERAIERGRP